jgi:hypothetical protein
MPFEMRLWQVTGNRLTPLAGSQLNQEQRLEDWIAQDPSILGMELAIFGRQVQTDDGGRVDLLALDRDGGCVIIELKRARTPREIVAQLLDYASWVVELDFERLEAIAQSFAGKPLQAIYEEAFGSSLPEAVNTSHHMILVAAELDASSERIINYLADHHDISINAVFFNFFASDGKELLGRAWLRDPVETIEHSEAKKRQPWSGYWFVNVGEDEANVRNWDDNRRYGYLGAGGGEKYSRPLQHLSPGDKVFAYMRGLGYVGFGEVTKSAVPIREFVPDGKQQPLLELPLKATGAARHSEMPELAEWAVGVRWISTVDRDKARTFKGVFANQNIVCKLRDQRTLDFLRTEFGAQ